MLKNCETKSNFTKEKFAPQEVDGFTMLKIHISEKIFNKKII